MKENIETESFSFYSSPIGNLKPLKTVSSLDVYELITSEKYKPITDELRSSTDEAEQKRIKSNDLDYVTFSGVFKERRGEDLLNHSRLICIDIDGLKDADEVEAIRALINETLPPLLIFVSPRGNGLKVVYRIDISSQTHLEYFHSLQVFFRTEIKIEIDGSCKDVARACFLCFDENAIHNPTSYLLDKAFIDTFSRAKRLEPQKPTIKPPTTYNEVLDITDEVLRRLKTWLDNKQEKYVQGNRHNYLIKLACAYNTFGVPRPIAESDIYSFLESDCSESHFKKIVDFAYSKVSDFGSKSFDIKQPYKFADEVESFNDPVREKISEGKADDNEHLKFLIDVDASYPEPPTILEIQKKPLFTRGGISTVIGKPKAGKTGASILFAAAALEGGRNESNSSLISATEPGTVIYIDNEQGKYYGSLTVARIKSIQKDCSNLKYYDFREHQPKKRMELMERALEYWSNKSEDGIGISLVVIDGIKDVVFDINNPEEATITVTELMRLSVHYDCHITSILHQNKGDSNARGHLGTELTNKSELVISVSRHESQKDFAVVSAEYSRGQPFEDFGIIRDSFGAPIIEANVPITTTPRKTVLTPLIFELDDHKKIAQSVFEKNKGIKYSNLISDVKASFEKLKKVSFGDTKARDFIRHWETEEIIFKTGAKPATKYFIKNDEKLL